MSGLTSLAPLTPLAAGLAVGYLMSRRKHVVEAGVGAGGDDANAAHVFMYPRGILKGVFACAIILPLVFLLLPDAAVQDARGLFNFGAIVFGGLLWFSWIYLYRYRIVVTRNEVRYGAFRMSSIDLKQVTAIKYFWVGNGIHLKLLSGSRRIGYFEGGIENFDGFAKAIRQRLPNDVHAETVGSASF
jgi:hypothetical protein